MSSHHLNELELIHKKLESDCSDKTLINSIFEKNKEKEEKQEQELDQMSINNKKYPKIVFLIILTEFCERFSYYGIRTVLYIYLTSFLKQNKDDATVIYHAFTVICYFTPLVGAILADGFIGLYGTILYVSIIYLIGEIILTATSLIPLGAPNLIGPCVGLFIIAIGTGGIKPCVSAFGGNQFESTQKRYLETFFSVFYLSINIGSMIGTILTPLLRSNVKCFGNDCYPLAFGVPLAFMLISVIFFVIGTRYYKRNFQKTNQNVILKTGGCIFSALLNRLKSPKNSKKHWLEYADKKYDSQLISNVKAFCHVMLVFVPIPLFWAIYDQQGSRWTSQAQQLSGRMGSFTLKPDQFQAINPLLIIILVPLFDIAIYPFLAKFNILKTHLQRMSIGLILAIISFIIAALLELNMQNAFLTLNNPNQIRLLNLSPCELNLYHNKSTMVLPIYTNLNNEPIKLKNFLGHDIFINSNHFFLKANSSCDNISYEFKIDNSNLPKTIIFYLETDRNYSMASFDYPYDINNQVIGSSQIKVSGLNLKNNSNLKLNLINYEIKSMNNSYYFDLKILNQTFVNSDSLTIKELKNYTTIDYADYKIELINEYNNILIDKKIYFETCGRYTILLFSKLSPIDKSQIDMVILTDIYPNGLHITWQIIQIFVMTLAEIMFSISGISFSYSQAPETMKSVLQGTWCLTVAIGNLIVVIVAEARFIENQVYEYLIFAGLLSIATLIFIIISYFYRYENCENQHKYETANSQNKTEKNLSENNLKYIKRKKFLKFAKNSSIKDAKVECCFNK